MPRNEEAERRRLRNTLKAVGNNLPDDTPGVESDDVGEIRRHGEDPEARMRRGLEHPHADARQEAVEDLELEED